MISQGVGEDAWEAGRDAWGGVERDWPTTPAKLYREGAGKTAGLVEKKQPYGGLKGKPVGKASQHHTNLPNLKKRKFHQFRLTGERALKQR